MCLINSNVQKYFFYLHSLLAMHKQIKLLGHTVSTMNVSTPSKHISMRNPSCWSLFCRQTPAMMQMMVSTNVIRDATSISIQSELRRKICPSFYPSIIFYLNLPRIYERAKNILDISSSKHGVAYPGVLVGFGF